MAPTDERKKRRRKKVARTEDFSSDSSDSSDSDNEKQQQQQNQEEQQQEAMEVDGEEEQDLTLHIDESAPVSEGKDATTIHPRMRIPEELLDVTKTDEAFQENYIKLMTSQFSDDIDSLRQSKDFGEKGLHNLINALKQGAEMFPSAEKRIINEAA